MAEYGIKQTFPDKLTAYSATAQNGLGVLRFEGDKVYRYVKAYGTLTGDALAAKNFVTYVGNAAIGVNDFVVTNVSGTVTAPAGVAISAIPENYYGWIQVGGPAACVGDGSVALGEAVVSNGDGTVDTMAAGEEHSVVGFAREADAATTNYVQVQLRGLV